MRKIIVSSIGVCLSLSLFVITPLQATNFEGKEEEYMERCSSSLSSNDKAICTEFNEYLKNKNADLKDQISDSQEKIDTTESDLAEVEKVLTDLNNDIVAKEEEIAYLDTSISNLQTSIDEKEEMVKDRMYAMQSYMNSNNMVDFIFGATSFADMLSRMDSVEELTDYDKQLIIDLLNDQAEIEEQKATVATAKANLENQKSQQTTLQTQYLALLNEQNTALKNQQDASDQLEQYSEEVNNALMKAAEESKETQIVGNVPVTGNSEVGKAIANAALTHRGKPYTWGGKGPNTFDCSGLVYYAFNQAGVKIGVTNAAGYSRYGKEISMSEAQAGDVVTYFGYGYVCHIAIFIDNKGTIVQAIGQANEINGQWGGNVRVNNVYDVSLEVYNVRRMY